MINKIINNTTLDQAGYQSQLYYVLINCLVSYTLFTHYNLRKLKHTFSGYCNIHGKKAKQ